MFWINYKEYPIAIQGPGRINKKENKRRKDVPGAQFIFHYELAQQHLCQTGSEIHCSNLLEIHQRTKRKAIKTSRKPN